MACFFESGLFDEYHFIIKYHFINKTNLRSERCIAQFFSMMMVTPYSL